MRVFHVFSVLTVSVHGMVIAELKSSAEPQNINSPNTNSNEKPSYHNRLIKQTNRVPHSYIVKLRSGVSPEDVYNHKKKVTQLQHVLAQKILNSWTQESTEQPFLLPKEAESPLGGIHSQFNLSYEFQGYTGYFTKHIVEQLKYDPLVEFIEEDSFCDFHSPVAVNKLKNLFKSQAFSVYEQKNPPWHLQMIATREYQFSKDYTYPTLGLIGEGVDIYVLDSGISQNHIDLKQKVTTGFSVNADQSDYIGHGTCIASLAAGTYAGVAKKANLISVKIADFHGDDRNAEFVGETRTGVLTKAFEYCINSHLQRSQLPGFRGSVINYSLGTKASKVIDSLVQSASSKGIHVVVSAGNDNVDSCDRSPSRSPYAITAGSVTKYGKKAKSSNWGSCVDVYAPGAGIMCAKAGSPAAFEDHSGTSYSAGVVSGAVAAFISYAPLKNSDYAANPPSPAQIKSALKAFATPVGNDQTQLTRKLYVGGKKTDFDNFYASFKRG